MEELPVGSKEHTKHLFINFAISYECGSWHPRRIIIVNQRSPITNHCNKYNNNKNIKIIGRIIKL